MYDAISLTVYIILAIVRAVQNCYDITAFTMWCTLNFTMLLYRAFWLIMILLKQNIMVKFVGRTNCNKRMNINIKTLYNFVKLHTY